MQHSGLAKIWVESGLLGPRTAERVLMGKIIANEFELTPQAMWQFLLPQLLIYIKEDDADLLQNLETYAHSSSRADFQNMRNLLPSERYIVLFH